MAGSSDVNFELAAKTFNEFHECHVNFDSIFIAFDPEVCDFCGNNQISKNKDRVESGSSYYKAIL